MSEREVFVADTLGINRTHFAVLQWLSRHGEGNVTTMASELGVHPNSLRHHLKDLTKAGVLSATEGGRGREVTFTLNRDKLKATIGELSVMLGTPPDRNVDHSCDTDSQRPTSKKAAQASKEKPTM